MTKLSRMEANKIVRRVLSRHTVDLSQTQYSVSGKDIRLTGHLCKTDGSHMAANHIETMVQEFMRYLPGFYITGDFDNWSFTSDHITYLGENDKESTYYEDEESTDLESEAS